MLPSLLIQDSAGNKLPVTWCPSALGLYAFREHDEEGQGVEDPGKTALPAQEPVSRKEGVGAMEESNRRVELRAQVVMGK